MKIFTKILSGSLIALILTTTGAEAGVRKYGEPVSIRQLTPIKDILADPKAFAGKRVAIEGKISQECPTGCWFYVKVAKGDFSIYVDIAPAGFAIQQHQGKKVVVEGIVVVKDSGPMIQGKAVEVR
jgi:hypothetical protein